MRMGIRLRPDATMIAARARAVESAGLDLVWVPDGGSTTTSAVALAAAVAARTDHVRIAVDVPLGDHHPLHAAEEVAVLDLVSAGRVVVVARAAEGCPPGRVEEALAVARAAWRARPFRHEGPTWTVPANLPANSVNIEDRIRVTPSPAQLVVPVWLQGMDELAARLDLPAVHDLGWPMGTAPTAEGPASSSPTPGLLRLPSGRPDVHALTSRLRGARRRLGLDLVVVDPVDGPGQVADLLAGRVRGALQLDRLPDGVEAEWDRREG